MLVGAIQGIVFSGIVVFSKKYQTKSLFFLAALILVFSLNNLQYFLLDTKVINFEAFFKVFYIPFATLSMVLYFFYVKFFLFPGEKITAANKLLFLPFFIFFGLTLFYKSSSAFGFLTTGISQFFSKLLIFHEGFALLFSLFLLILIFRRIFLFEKIHKNSPKDRIKWLKYTSIISLFITVIYGISIYMDSKSGTDSSNFYYLLWVCQSFVIYWLGHVGIYQFGIREEQIKIRKLSTNQRVLLINPNKNEYISAFEKYIVEDKNYLNSELTLENVSDQLGLSKSYLSRLINAELHSSFTDYINSLRVEEAKLTIQNPESEKYTMIAIGLESGFNSKSTFNNAFKKHTGFTPSEFKKDLKNSQQKL